ncbi:MAG TPA: site-specific integrase, partial [Actinobacteria bacterium]|nr:site-specific integrase [Actinomycetota bacterium]
PGFLTDLLGDHLDRHVADDPDELVFTTPAGTPMRNSNFRRQVWYPAIEEAALPPGLRIHDLRHTCASLLAAAGATPKAVQVHLGHSSITVTMDRYTHLFPSDVDTLIRRLDDIRARNRAAQTRPTDQSRGIELGGR